MGLELKQSLKLAQQLVMTPQLQQAIKLLQLNHLELAELVEQEMVENPVLEEGPQDVPEAEFDARPKAEAMAPEDPNAEGRREETDLDWERYLEGSQEGPRLGPEARADLEDLPGYDQTLTRAESLAEHLMWQLHMVDAPRGALAAASSVVGNLDERGYLPMTLAELAEDAGLSVEDAQAGLDLVQALDPLGIGARSLSECLLIQAKTLHPNDHLLQTLVRDHLSDLERKDYKTIAKSMSISVQKVSDLVRTMGELDPRPARNFSSDEPRYIAPDIYVVKHGDEYHIQLNEEGVPKLKVSDYYKRVMMGAASGDKEYIQEKLRSAQWLIRSIFQRQRTIYKVTESIVRQQRAFFDEGISRLRPMVLRDVADDIGMHESTISRVTSNKYVHTPHGLVPLKRFFNSAIQREDGGDDVASEAVKQRIKQLVERENPRNPYSDQQLVDLLFKENIKIARRTVAKYREMQGILSSAQRKRPY